MPAGPDRNLRPVGDEQHLSSACQKIQPFGQMVQGHAANTAVHLVEDKGRVAGRVHHTCQCQQKARELAARSNVVQRLGRLARVRGPENAHRLVLHALPKLLRTKIRNDAHVLVETKTFQLALKRPGKNLARGVAYGTYPFHHILKLFDKLSLLALQVLDVQLAHVEKGNLLLNLVLEVQDFRQGSAQLALQFRYLVEPCLHLFYVLWQIVRPWRMAQGRGQLLQLLVERGERLRTRSKIRIELCHVFHKPEQIAKAVQKATPRARAVEHPECRVVLPCGLLQPARPLPYLLKLLFLARFRIHLVYLGLLHLQKIAHLKKPCPPFLYGAPLCKQIRKPVCEPVALVQQILPLHGLLHERVLESCLQELLLAVLACVGNELFAQKLRIPLRLQGTVDCKPAAPRGQKVPAQNELPVRALQRFVAPLETLGVQRLLKAKQSLHMGPVRTRSDHVALQPVPKQKSQGLQNKALACARLASEHVHAPAEFELHVLYERKVLYAQILKHNHRPSLGSSMSRRLSPSRL